MPLLLARIDDRLIHGQVVHGWGGTLRPTWIGIVSDALTREPARAALYVFAAPEESRAEVISIPEALRESTLQTIRAERSFLLFPSVLEPLRLKLKSAHSAEGISTRFFSPIGSAVALSVPARKW